MSASAHPLSGRRPASQRTPPEARERAATPIRDVPTRRNEPIGRVAGRSPPIQQWPQRTASWTNRRGRNVRTPADHVVVCPVMIGRQHDARCARSRDRALPRPARGRSSPSPARPASEVAPGQPRPSAGPADAQPARHAGPVLRARRVAALRADRRPAPRLHRHARTTARWSNASARTPPEIVKILPDLTSLHTRARAGARRRSRAGEAPDLPRPQPVLHARRIARPAARGHRRPALERRHQPGVPRPARAAHQTLPVLVDPHVSQRRGAAGAPQTSSPGSTESGSELEWPLARLSTGEVSDMISAIFELDTPARPEFIDALYSLTEGNPFFLEEVLKSLVASGRHLLQRTASGTASQSRSCRSRAASTPPWPRARGI